MKKLIALVLALVVVLGLTGCFFESKHKVEFADNYPIVNNLKKTYSAGEEVTIKLETITEHYYIVSVNSMPVERDTVKSDMEYTFFTFIMPNEDVLIEIEDKWVDIPVASQQ